MKKPTIRESVASVIEGQMRRMRYIFSAGDPSKMADAILKSPKLKVTRRVRKAKGRIVGAWTDARGRVSFDRARRGR